MSILILSALAADGFGTTVQSSLLTISYSPQASVVLHEPILVEFRVENNLPETIHMDLGWNRTSAFVLSIKQPDGKTIQAPPPVAEGIGRRGKLTLEPGASYSQKLLLNEWSSFEQVGSYEAAIRLTSPIAAGRGQAVETARIQLVKLHVVGRNESALDEICRQLADTAWSAAPAESYEAALFLSHVNDPVGVRYMRYVLSVTDRHDPLILSGLHRINSTEARTVLAEAADTGTGERAQVARSLLQSLQRRNVQQR